MEGAGMCPKFVFQLKGELCLLSAGFCSWAPALTATSWQPVCEAWGLPCSPLSRPVGLALIPIPLMYILSPSPSCLAL